MTICIEYNVSYKCNQRSGDPSNFHFQSLSNRTFRFSENLAKSLCGRIVFQIALKIKPKVLVDYDRRAYFNKYGLLFRLTFDTNILSSPSNELFNNKFSNFKETRAGYVVLELKFERSIQPWFHRIIQNYNLSRMSISKFAIGMEKSGFGRETSD